METFVIVYHVVMGLLILVALVVGVVGFFASIGDRDLTYLLRWSVFPGVAQLINGDKKKGKILIAVSIIPSAVLVIDYLLIITEITDNQIPVMICLPLCIGLQLYSLIDAVFVGSKKSDYELGKRQEAELQKESWADGSPKPEAPPVSKGGFQRKVKGTPRFKSLDPLPDEDKKPKDGKD